jgi:lipopolysaccharide export system permease protein
LRLDSHPQAAIGLRGAIEMNAFDRLVIRQLSVGVILVSAVLTCIIWLTQSLRFIDWIVNRDLDSASFLHLIMLLLPDFLVIILPIAVFMTILFLYTRMINDREMVVMRAAGVSPLGLARPAIIIALLVTACAYAMHLLAVPSANRALRALQWEIRYNVSHVLLEEGTFNDFGDGITLYVRERSGDEQLRGILAHDSRDPEKIYTLMAERGALVRGHGGASRVILFNGSRQEVDKENHSLSILYFERYAFELSDSPDGAVERRRDPRERPLGELLDVKNDPTVAPKDHGRYLVAAHHRLTAPLSALTYALIGLACLLKGPFRRSGQAPLNSIAVALVVFLGLSALGVENIAARHPVVLPLMYVIALVPAIVAFAVLAGVKGIPWRIGPWRIGLGARAASRPDVVE